MYCDNASTVDIRQVEKMLEETFGHFMFSSLPDKSRTCPRYIAKTIYANDEDDEPPMKNELFSEPKLLGLHPGSSEKILLKNSPYGFYVQLGEDRNGYLPKRASVSQIKDVDSVTVEGALDLLRYPIKLGNHPDDSEPVYIKLAKHGFSIRHRRTIAPVPKNMDPKDITFEKL